MKIAISTSGLPPGFGISVFVDELSKWFFNRKDYDIMVFATTSQILSPDDYLYPVEYFKIPASKAEEFIIIKKFKEKLFNFDPDVLIINNCIYASNILPILKRECIRLSYVHGYRERFGINGHKGLTRAAIHNHEYLDWIIASNSPMYNGLVKDYKIPSYKIKIIYSGINKINFNQSYNKKNVNKTIFFFAGGTTSVKGWDTLFKAIIKLKDLHPDGWKFIWLGGAKMPPRSIKNSGLLENYIEWKSIIPLEDLHLYLSKSHVLVMPSRAEGCPMLLLRAMSLGLSSIVSDCPSAMMEIINNSDSGLITKVGNFKELAKGLKYLLDNPNKIKTMSSNAKYFFNNNLHIDVTSKKLEKLLDRNLSASFPETENISSLKIYPFHRKPFIFSKFNPIGLYERYIFYSGILPIPFSYKLHDL